MHVGPAALAAFPARHDIGTAAVPGLPGLCLRPLSLQADLAWLRALYADTRAHELAHVPWPDAAKAAFLDQQFALQHAHYTAHYGDADFLAIEHEGAPVGRYYLLQQPRHHLIVDISLAARWRGRGIGTALVRASQVQAQRLGRGMCLHVARDNHAARRLYERLGFVMAAAGTDTHHAMQWGASTDALS